MRAAAVAVLVALVSAISLTSCAAPTVQPSPSPSPSAPATTAPAPSPSPSPSPSPTPAPARLVATPAGELPAEPRIVVTAWGPLRMAWLGDLAGGGPAKLVARWEVVDDESGDIEASATPDGRYLLAAARGEHDTSALHLVDVASGEVRVLHDEPGAHATRPRLDPRAERYAFVRVPVASGEADGIWAAAVGDEAPQRIAGPFVETAVPLAWSPDGSLLAFRLDSAPPRVRVVPAGGGVVEDAGPGSYADWREDQPRLLVSGLDGDGTYGLWAYDTDSGERAIISAGREPRLADARWRPGGGRIAYLEDAGSLQRRVMTRDLAGGQEEQVGATGYLSDIFWTDDGESLFARFGGDDSSTGLLDLLGRRPGPGTLCLRGGTPPGPCL